MIPGATAKKGLLEKRSELAPKPNSTDMEPRLDIVTFGVVDASNARKFYEDRRKRKASTASQGDMVFFQLGAMVLGLDPRKLLSYDAAVPPSGSGLREVRLARDDREKADVAAALRRRSGPGVRL